MKKKLKEIHISKEYLLSFFVDRMGGNYTPARELLKQFEDGKDVVFTDLPYSELKVKAVYK